MSNVMLRAQTLRAPADFAQALHRYRLTTTATLFNLLLLLLFLSTLLISYMGERRSCLTADWSGR
jgi:hypothetical protein